MKDPFKQPTPITFRRVNRWLVAGGVVGGVLLVVAIIFFVGYLNRDRSVIGVLPVESIFFVEYQAPLLPWQDRTVDRVITTFPVSWIEQQFQWPAGTVDSILTTSEAAAIAGVYNNQGQLALIVVSRGSVVPGGSTVGDYSVATTDSETAALVAKTISGEFFSLASRLPQGLGHNNRITFYLDPNQLSGLITTPSVAALFHTLPAGSTIIGAGNFDSEFYFHLGSSITTNQLAPLLSSLETPIGDLYAAPITLQQLFESWAVANPDFVTTLSQLNAGNSALYGQDYLTPLIPLLQQPGRLAIFATTSDRFFGNDFAFIAPRQSGGTMSAFEKYIRLVIAQKIPIKKVHRLPDDSVVTELLVNAEAYQWQSADFSDGLTGRGLSVDEIGLDLAYITTQNETIVGSSAGVEQFLASSPTAPLCQYPKELSMLLAVNTNIALSQTVGSVKSGLIWQLPTGEVAGCIY